MIGCVCCHGPTDENGNCYRCDWQKIRGSPLTDLASTPTPPSIQVKDWLGTEMGIGDTVIYPSRQSSSLWVNEGKIVSLEMIDPPYLYNKGTKVPQVGILRSRSSGWRGKDPGKKVSYPDVGRITVIKKHNES